MTVTSWAAGPIVRAWISVVSPSWENIPRPPDRGTAYTSGSNPIKVLLVGSGQASGWGVSSHDLALPGTIARALSVSLDRAVEVDVVSDTTMTARSAPSLLRGVNISAYSAVLMVVGMNDTLELTSPRAWTSSYRRLLDTVLGRGSASTTTFASTIGPMPALTYLPRRMSSLMTRHSATLNARLRRLCDDEPSVHLVQFPSNSSIDTDRHRSPETYRKWGEDFAEQMATVLREKLAEGANGVDSARPAVRAEERSRLDALTRLNILDTPPEERFDRIVEFARATFGTSMAALTFIDEKRQWFKVARGFEPRLNARAGSFCDVTIRGPGVFVVENAAVDPVFHGSPYVTTEGGVAFYAGYPIASPEGERIGALCIMDSSPRELDDAERSTLRDLALLLQRELWDRHANSRVRPVPSPRGGES